MAHASPWHVLASQTQQVSPPCWRHALSSHWVHAHSTLSPHFLILPEHEHLPITFWEADTSRSQQSHDALVNVLPSNPESFELPKEEVSPGYTTKQHSGRQWTEMELMGRKGDWEARKNVPQLDLRYPSPTPFVCPGQGQGRRVPIPTIRNENSQEENTFKNTTQLRYYSEFFSKNDALEKRIDVLNGLPVQRNKRQGMTLLLIFTHLLREEHSWYSDKYSSRDSYLSQLATWSQRRSKSWIVHL